MPRMKSADESRGAEPLLFLLLLFCYVWPIDLDPGVNVWAHVDQAAAIVAHRTLAMDAFMQPPNGPNTVDYARTPDGHFYPAKAPGLAMIAVPVMAVLYTVESAVDITPFEGNWFRRNAIILNWVMNSLLSALGMTVLLRVVVRHSIRLSAAVLAVIAIGLGTAYYPYATTYYTHNPAANVIVFAAALIFTRSLSPARLALAGCLLGVAVMIDFSGVFAVLVFAAVIALTDPRGLVAYAAGGLFPLVLLLGYHTIVFGGPFTTGYKFMNPRVSPVDGVLLHLPDPTTPISLTVTPYRGIFFYSPVLLLACAGVWHAWRGRSAPRTIFWAGPLLFLFVFGFTACYYMWWGGWTAGTRYIIPGLVLLAPVLALAFERHVWVGGVLLALSIANHVAIAAVQIVVDEDVLNPLADVIYPGLWRGAFQRSSLGRFLLGLEGHAALAVFLAVAAIIAMLLWRRIAAIETVLRSRQDGTTFAHRAQ